jgi:hypothetical protein
MDMNGWLLIGMAIVFLIAVVVFVYAAIMRMTGRRSRFDGLAETFVRAQGAGVYPASLRGDPNPQVVEEIEVDRGTTASRKAPNVSSPDSHPE